MAEPRRRGSGVRGLFLFSLCLLLQPHPVLGETCLTGTFTGGDTFVDVYPDSLFPLCRDVDFEVDGRVDVVLCESGGRVSGGWAGICESENEGNACTGTWGYGCEDGTVTVGKDSSIEIVSKLSKDSWRDTTWCRGFFLHGIVDESGTSVSGSVEVQNCFYPGLFLSMPVTLTLSDSCSRVHRTGTCDEIQLVDPNPLLLDAKGALVVQTDALSSIGTQREGVAADGVTRLLLRLPVAGSEKVTFSFAKPEDEVFGSFSKVGELESRSSSVVVDPQVDASGQRWAFAIYTSPAHFTSSSPGDRTRSIVLQASSASMAEPLHRSLMLEPPPVVLVHGLWSNAAMWAKGGFQQHLQESGFVTQAADYGFCSSCSFLPVTSRSIGDNPLAGAVLNAIEEVSRSFRNRGVAVTQADVVTHSMGGLAARSLAAYPLYHAPANFGAGYIHKLITIGTPHFGSPFATFMWQHKDVAVTLPTLPWSEPLTDLLSLVNMSLDGPALLDLQPDSVALYRTGATAVAGHSVAADALEGTCGEVALNVVLNLIEFPNSVDSLLGEGNDTIVPLHSQVGGLNVFANQADRYEGQSGILHARVCPNDVTETSDVQIQDRIVQLLRTDVANPAFAAGWPTPSSLMPSSAANSSVALPQAGIPTDGISTTEATGDGSLGIQLMAPATGTIVQPGDTLVLAATPVGGLVLQNVVFLVETGEEVPSIVPAAAGLPESTFLIPLDFVGSHNVAVLASDAAGNLYGDAGSFVVQPAAPLRSVTVTPTELELAHAGQQVALSVVGTYGDAIARDLRSSGAATTYRTLSGDQAVVAVSVDGVVTAHGDGSETVVVTNAGHTKTVHVVVSIEERCGQPLTRGAGPTARDCLFILKAAVGSESCAPECVCDVNDSAAVTATDALMCLKNAVGQPTILHCAPECTGTASIATPTITTLP